MIKDAVLSEDRSYRYALWRTWDKTKDYVMFIGLNPSTADETEDDPTISRCVNFAKKWGYGGICMVNLFAYRATEPSVMKLSEDPIGKDNDEWIKKLSSNAGVIVGCWGNHGCYLKRSKDMLQLVPNIRCLKQNKTGEPSHPLYLNGSLVPIKLK